MKMELDLLQTQNQDLNEDNQSILLSLINSRHTVDLVSASCCYDFHNLELRNYFLSSNVLPNAGKYYPVYYRIS